MRIRYDSNNFIIGVTTDDNSFNSEAGYFDTVVDDIRNFEIFDRIYGLPLYKYIEGEIVRIEAYSDYSVNYNYSRICKNKRLDEFTQLIMTKTTQELKDMYDTLDSDCKLVFVEALNTFWANEQTQFNQNLTYEAAFRILMEALYIKEVEQRSFTQDEADLYYGMLNAFHSHVSNVGGYTPSSWCLSHISEMLDQCDDIRFNKLMPQRYFIAGY